MLITAFSSSSTWISPGALGLFKKYVRWGGEEKGHSKAKKNRGRAGGPSMCVRSLFF